MNIKLLKQLRKNITIYYNNINKVYKVVDNIDSIIEYFGEEDTRNEYDRRRCLVCSDDGQEWEAYVYVWPEKKALPRKTIVLPEGRWPAKI